MLKLQKKLGIKVNLENRNWDTIVPEINSQAVLYGFGSGMILLKYIIYIVVKH